MNESSDQLFCMPQCVYGRVETDDAEMVRCCLCYDWFHIPCIGLSNGDDTDCFISCLYCRKISQDVRKIKEDHESLMAVIKSLQDSVSTVSKSYDHACHQIITLNETNNSLSEENLALREENAGLRKRVDELTDKLTAKVWNFMRDNSNEKSLLIGDLTIKDIDKNKLRNTDVMCIPGAKVQQIHDELKNQPESFATVTLVVGTNDCATARSKEEVVTAYDSLLGTAVGKVASPNNVTVCSILPRHDKAANNVRLLNKELESLSLKHDAKFTSNDASFLLGDGSLNDGYFTRENKDGRSVVSQNPSFHGTQRLAKNLGLRILPQHTENVCKSRRQIRNQKPTLKFAQHDDKPTANIPRHQQKQAYHQPKHQKKTRNYDQRIFCYYCGESNHSYGECRHGRPIKCSACNTEGHKAKHCSA